MSKNKQWVYIDDSGDPGFKIGIGSSRYFVIACIIFDKKEDIDNAVRCIDDLKTELGWKNYREFKSNKTNANIKTSFFNKVCNECNFRVRAILVDKTIIYSDTLKNDTIKFYNFIIREVLSKTALNQAKIVLDGHADRDYKKQAASYIRKVAGGDRGRINDVKFVISSNSNLVQIADMVAGTIRRNAEGLSDGEVCLKILGNRGKVEDIWDFK